MREYSKMLGVTLMLILCTSVLIAKPKTLQDDISRELESAIKKAIQKHALYSFNIANATTPGFSPILFPEDQAEFEALLPKNQPYSSKVLVEHVSAKMAENSRRHAAYYALYKKRIDNIRQVVTLGKK